MEALVEGRGPGEGGQQIIEGAPPLKSSPLPAAHAVGLLRNFSAHTAEGYVPPLEERSPLTVRDFTPRGDTKMRARITMDNKLGP